MAEERFTVEHRPEEHRYVLLDREADSAVIGEVTYASIDDDGGPSAKPRRILDHTGVRDEYSGQGLASQLVRFVMDDCIDAGVSIVPVCPYVASWVAKHPEYEPYTVEPSPTDLAAE